MVRAVRSRGLEACVTLGMLTEDASLLPQGGSGLTAYNHNLDTSRAYYGNITTTRNYDDRLHTIAAVQKAGIAVCCGGILGLGEPEEDRLRLLAELLALAPPPESIPINCLVPIPGTPLANQAPVDSFELVRLVATTRIAFPRARVRLSAGRDRMSRELQALCFLAGANSLFYGDRLLTAANPSAADDSEMFRAPGSAGRRDETLVYLKGVIDDGPHGRNHGAWPCATATRACWPRGWRWRTWPRPARTSTRPATGASSAGAERPMTPASASSTRTPGSASAPSAS